MPHEAAYQPVTAVIGGQQRTLRLTLRGVRLLREKLGADGLTALQDTASAADPFAQIDKIGAILWVLMGDESLSVEQVEAMVDFRELDAITQAITQVFETDIEATPDGDDEGKAGAAPV
jgi:hypothetical protein